MSSPFPYIYIPTRGRVETQKTWDRLPAILRLRTRLVCPTSEADDHQRQNRIVLPCSVNKPTGMCLAETRDFIMRYAEKANQERIVVLDDDVTLLVRQPLKRGQNPRFLTAYDERDWVKAFAWLNETTMKYAHAAWGMRQHHWDYKTNKKDQLEVGRALGCCMAFNVEMAGRFRFTEGLAKGSPMSDFNMTLQLLRAGLPNAISLVYRASPGPANAPGGCSGARTGQLQSATAERLGRLYPDVVKVVQKKAWAGMETETMSDVHVGWKKAYRPVIE